MARLITHKDGKRTRIWSEPGDRTGLDLRLGFVAATWLLGAVLSIAFAMAIYAVASNFVDNDPDASAAGLLTVATGFGSALGFLCAGLIMLRKLPTHRLPHGIAVAMLHLVVLALVLAANALLRATVGTDMSDLGAHSAGTAEAAVGFFALERSAVTAVAGCMLATALMPARGPVPRGTQVGAPDSEHSL